MKVWENYLLIFSIHQTICIAGIFHSAECRIDFYCLLPRPLFRLSYLNRLLIREISQLFPVERAIFFLFRKRKDLSQRRSISTSEILSKIVFENIVLFFFYPKENSILYDSVLCFLKRSVLCVLTK